MKQQSASNGMSEQRRGQKRKRRCGNCLELDILNHRCQSSQTKPSVESDLLHFKTFVGG